MTAARQLWLHSTKCSQEQLTCGRDGWCGGRCRQRRCLQHTRRPCSSGAGTSNVVLVQADTGTTLQIDARVSAAFAQLSELLSTASWCSGATQCIDIVLVSLRSGKTAVLLVSHAREWLARLGSKTRSTMWMSASQAGRLPTRMVPASPPWGLIAMPAGSCDTITCHTTAQSHHVTNLDRLLTNVCLLVANLCLLVCL